MGFSMRDIERQLDAEEREYERAMAEPREPYPVSKRHQPPTWEAQQLAEVRTYEAKTRMADLGAIGVNGVNAVVRVHESINALGDDIHPALHNELRQIETQTVQAVIRIIRRHAG